MIMMQNKLILPLLLAVTSHFIGFSQSIGISHSNPVATSTTYTFDLLFSANNASDAIAGNLRWNVFTGNSSSITSIELREMSGNYHMSTQKSVPGSPPKNWQEFGFTWALKKEVPLTGAPIRMATVVINFENGIDPDLAKLVLRGIGNEGERGSFWVADNTIYVSESARKSQQNYPSRKEYLLTDDNKIGSNLLIYPNPVKDYLKITGSVRGNIQILNNTGKVVYSADYIPTEGIDMASLSAGVYLVRVLHKDGSSTIRKVLKQ